MHGYKCHNDVEAGHFTPCLICASRCSFCFIYIVLRTYSHLFRICHNRSLFHEDECEDEDEDEGDVRVRMSMRMRMSVRVSVRVSVRMRMRMKMKLI